MEHDIWQFFPAIQIESREELLSVALIERN